MPIVKRASPFTVSIKNDTWRIVSSSEDNFGGLVPGSFIKLGRDNFLHQIVKIDRFFYTQKFKLIDSRVLEINFDTGIELQQNDIINISYSEYELEMLVSICNDGFDYQPNDELTVNGGVVSTDISTGLGFPTKFIVNAVTMNGGISQLSIQHHGQYLEPPNNKALLFGGSGDGAEVELSYRERPIKSKVKRTISKIEFKDNKTIITLDYPINNSIKEGNISVEKYELFLLNKYTGPTERNIPYEIFKDATPNLQLPLLIPNSLSTQLLFNESMRRLDLKIAELDDRIRQIERQLNRS